MAKLILALLKSHFCHLNDQFLTFLTWIGFFFFFFHAMPSCQDACVHLHYFPVNAVTLYVLMLFGRLLHVSARPVPWWRWASLWQQLDLQVSLFWFIFTKLFGFWSSLNAVTKEQFYNYLKCPSNMYAYTYLLFFVCFLTQQGALPCRPWSRWSLRWNKPFRASLRR